MKTALLSTLLLGAWLASGPVSAQGTAILADRIYTAPDEPPVLDAVILVRDGVIQHVGPRHATTVPDGHHVLDWSGHTVTAGFWNSHVHLVAPVYMPSSQSSDAAVQAELERSFTRWGFTTVFDLASTTAIGEGIAQRIRDGHVPGPRVLSVGEPFYPEGATPIYARSYYEEFGLPSAEVSTPEQAAERVRTQIRNGADGIKIFAGSIVGGEADVVTMPGTLVATISEEATRLGKPVFAHPTNRAGLEVAVGNGADILAHAAPLMGSWSVGYAQWLAAKGVALIPTLSLFELDPHPSTPVAVAVQQTAALHKAGGTVLFGTDAGFTPEYDPRAELRLLGEAIGWPGVLASMTTAPAELFGEGELRGRIAPGFAADLVAIGGDPAGDVTRLADVRRVMIAGKVVFDADHPASACEGPDSC